MTNDLNSKFFIGNISNSDPGTYMVHVETKGDGMLGLIRGIPLIHIVATTLGFKESIVYPIGAQVLCLRASGDTCIIFGIIPDHDVGRISFFSRAFLGTEDTNSQDAPSNTQGYKENAINIITNNICRPTDVAEGEYVISNELGVLFGLLQELALLKGSELAQVQCYLLDDLVRIISHNFQHWTSMGEVNIWHDGKALMAEYGATHLSGESIGIPQTTKNKDKPFVEGDPPKPDDSSDYYKIDADERLKAIERLKIFVGRLGDFFHLFLARPDDETKRDLSGEMTGRFDRGLLDTHISADGRLSVRSVNSMSFEKVSWIRVPLRVRTPEDPKGDDTTDIEFEKKPPFEWDNSMKVRENPVGYFLQLRDYLAYTQDKYNYLNFKKYKKDFKISDSAKDNEKSLKEIKDIDPDTETKLGDYQLRNAGVYFMDNGGITIKDAWGSALVFEGGDISLQPARDFIAQPLRNFVGKIGHSLQMAAKKHIDFSSTEEGFRLKTKLVQHLYSTHEGIIVQTDTANEYQPPSPEDEAYDHFGGILLLAKGSGVFTYGKKIYDRSQQYSLYKSDKELVVDSEANIWLVPKGNTFIMPDKDVIVCPKKDVIILTEGAALFGGQKSTALGQEGKVIAMAPHPGSIGATLDGVLDIPTIADPLLKSKDQIADAVQQIMRPFNEDANFLGVKFRFLKSDKFELSKEHDFIPMTISQQDDKQFNFLKLDDWMETEVEATLPYPGKDRFEDFYLTYRLSNIRKSEDFPKDYESKGFDELTAQAGNLVNESLLGYKVWKNI